MLAAPTIYSIGSINIDQICWIGKGIGESRPITKYERLVGGKGINQSEAVRRAGGTVHFLGRVGRDCCWILCELRDRHGFPTENILKCTDEYTGHVIINKHQDDEENVMLYYLGANSRVSLDDANIFLEGSSEGDVLLVQNEIGGMLEILKLARGRNMRVCFNPSPSIDDQWTAADYSCAWLILNEHEFAHLLKLYCSTSLSTEDGMSKLQHLTNTNNLICTFGDRGAVGLDAEGVFHHVDAPSVDTIDTVGAGDCFAGYFISCICSKRYTFAECLQIAVTAASLKVTQKGAFDGIPRMDQVLQHPSLSHLPSTKFN